MAVARTQTLVQMTSELLALLDQRAARDCRSRSELICEAVEQYLAEDRAASINRAIVEGYTRQPDDEFDYTDAAKRLIAEEPW
jgi:metal-responsive CopG/Arc/MetJ family transcriptional regulator